MDKLYKVYIKKKTALKITLIEAVFILIVSRWRSIKWFGLPKGIGADGTVLITSGDGTIVDVAQWFYEESKSKKKKGEKIRWQQGGLSHELIPEHRNAEWWRPKPKSPFIWTFIF